MRFRQIGWTMGILMLFFWIGVASAQKTSGDTQLRIRLRQSDGTAVTGETIILQRLPEEESIALKCETNTNGECTWYVKRGLYQLLFTRPLDDISSLAVAEGGLRGFGVTVGDEAITYRFTFHSDGRVYFDAAPDAAIPSPIIPTGDTLHGGIAPTPTFPVIEVEETATPEPTNAPDTAVDSTSSNAWRIALLIGGGLVVGGGVYLLQRHPEQASSRRQTTRSLGQKTTRLPGEETDDA